MRLWFYVVLFLLAFTIHVNAQTTEKQQDSLSKSPKTLLPVTISAVGSKHADAVYPIDLLATLQIKNNSVVDLVQVINITPGVFVQSGAINTNRITIRGVGSRTLYGTNKIKAYYNGIPITNGVGETDISSYDPDDLQSLEIIKGPKASIYGSGLGGVILLTPKYAKQGMGTTSKVSIGSFGLFKNSTSVSYGNTNLKLHIAYNHLQKDGFRENNGYNRNGYLVSGSYQITKNQKLHFLVNQAFNKAYIPSSIGKTAFENQPESAAFSWGAAQGFEANAQTLAGVSYEMRFSNTLTNATSIFYNYLDHYEPRPFNILDEYTHGYGTRTVFVKRFTSVKNAVLSFGGEWYRDHYNWNTHENLYQENSGNGSLAGKLLSSNLETRNSVQFFTTFKLPVTPRLNVEVGLNVNKTNFDFQDNFNVGEASNSANRNFKVVMAPNLNFTYALNQQSWLYANIGKGFNYPSLEETLTPDGVINPAIAPEKGWNYEIGANLVYNNQNLMIRPALYWLAVTDLLVADRTGDDQYIGRNAGKTNHKGIELAIRYNWTINGTWQLQPFVNTEFNFHRFNDFDDGVSDYSGNKLTGVPDKKIVAGITLKHHTGLYLYTNYMHVGAMPMNDANSLYSKAYNLVAVRIGYNYRLNNALTIGGQLGVHNIMNTKYASSILINAVSFGNTEPRYYYPGEPINYYGGLQVQWQL